MRRAGSIFSNVKLPEPISLPAEAHKYFFENVHDKVLLPELRTQNNGFAVHPLLMRLNIFKKTFNGKERPRSTSAPTRIRTEKTGEALAKRHGPPAELCPPLTNSDARHWRKLFFLRKAMHSRKCFLTIGACHREQATH